VTGLRAGLSLAEEIVLLSLDDETGRPIGRAGMAPDLALAGALLMELALARRIDTDRERLWVMDDAPTWDPVLDAALGELASPGAPCDARAAIILLARDAASVRATLVDRLIAAGLLHRLERNVLWLFNTSRHPKPERCDPAAAARERIRSAVLAEEIPDPRDALLLGLARAAGLVPLIFSDEALARCQRWLGVVTRIESLNRSLGSAVAAAHARRSPR
jgi:hypothetical protein